MVVHIGLSLYVVETFEGVLPVVTLFSKITLVVLNVPLTPIKVTVLVELVVVFTIPYMFAFAAGWVTYFPAVKLWVLSKVSTISVTAVRTWLEVVVALPGVSVEVCNPFESKYTTPWVDESASW